MVYSGITHSKGEPMKNLSVLVVFDGENPLYLQRLRFSDQCPIVTENVNDAIFYESHEMKRKQANAGLMQAYFGMPVYSQVQPGIGHKKDNLKFSELVSE
jgi:hypothetical protein